MSLKNWLDNNFSKPFYFDRIFLLVASLLVIIASFVIALLTNTPDVFASAGAWITLAGLMLNIKYTLIFHLDIPLKDKHEKASGAFALSSANELTEEEEKEINSILSDEIFGVTYMVFGTLIWAYGSFLVDPLITC